MRQSLISILPNKVERDLLSAQCEQQPRMCLDFRIDADAAEKQPDIRLALIERLHECLVIPVEDEDLPVEILDSPQTGNEASALAQKLLKAVLYETYFIS